jgi:hypothetical protein
MTIAIASHPLNLPELTAIAKFPQFTTTHVQRIPQTPFIPLSRTSLSSPTLGLPLLLSTLFIPLRLSLLPLLLLPLLLLSNLTLMLQSQLIGFCLL